MKRLIKQVEAQGFEVRLSKKGHYLFDKDGQRVAVASGTPSDHHARRNLLADLKRAGFDPTA